MITMGQYTDTHKALILAYPNANHSVTEIGRKLVLVNLQLANFNSGRMSASGDLAVPMSFSRERDPGTGTKNKIVTDCDLVL